MSCLLLAVPNPVSVNNCLLRVAGSINSKTGTEVRYCEDGMEFVLISNLFMVISWHI